MPLEGSSTDPGPPALILCDFAEVINGKLYIQGGGWSRLVANQPVAIAVALHWLLPWGQANQRQRMEFRLVTEDGEPFVGPDDQPVRVEGDIEVGRPPGTTPGSALEAPVALKFVGVSFPPGRYRFEFHVNGHLEAQASFEAVGAPA